MTTTRLTQRSNGITWLQFPAEACNACALKNRCTSSPNGRSVTIGSHETLLADARAFQRTPEFKTIYNCKRPTVERVIYRIVRDGGRKARYRGRVKVLEQLRTKAAAENFLRMLRLGLASKAETGWSIA